MELDEEMNTCCAIGTKKAQICLPVSIYPYAVTSPATVTCCGEAKAFDHCDKCDGEENGCCTFVISQMIKVDVPVEFGANIKIGDTYVECMETEIEDCCEHEKEESY